jgi:ribosome-associated protein
MIYFDLEQSPYIELIKLLKAENIASSGAEAKMMVDDHIVKVNGEIETRKRAKLREGDTVEVEGWTIQITRK